MLENRLRRSKQEAQNSLMCSRFTSPPNIYLYWIQDVLLLPFILYLLGCFWMGDEGGVEVVWSVCFGLVFLNLRFCGHFPPFHTLSNIYTSIFEEAVEANQIMTR